MSLPRDPPERKRRSGRKLENVCGTVFLRLSPLEFVGHSNNVMSGLACDA
jgi:hypothetical protein